MPLPRVRVPATDEFRAGFAAIRERLEIPAAMPPEVEAAARSGRSSGPWAIAGSIAGTSRFVTIDPVGSRDLDQALHVQARGEGHRVHYAIADVAAFVDPG